MQLAIEVTATHVAVKVLVVEAQRHVQVFDGCECVLELQVYGGTGVVHPVEHVRILLVNFALAGALHCFQRLVRLVKVALDSSKISPAVGVVGVPFHIFINIGQGC